MRRPNPSVSTDASAVLPTDEYVPQVGDRHSLAPANMYPFDAVVVAVSSPNARIAHTSPGGAPEKFLSVEMPVESVAHFVNDLRGHVYGHPADDPIVNAIVHGDAQFLGKGDDGLAFRIDTSKGALVAKVSTTVPYQPFNRGHLTPARSIDRLESQQQASDAMAAAGVPGILPSSFVRHGDKGYMIKPYVEIPEHLTRVQLDEAAASVEAAHKAGWAFHDRIQVGLWDGHVYHFDTGKAEHVGIGKRSNPEEYDSDAHDDIQSLKRLFDEQGELYLTAAEQINPIKEFEALYGVSAQTMTAAERRRYRVIVRLLQWKIKAFLQNHPGEDHGLWSEIPEYLDDEVRAMMKQFQEPT